MGARRMKPKTMSAAKPLPPSFHFCAECQASVEWCKHLDPVNEMTRDELLALVKVLRERK